MSFPLRVGSFLGLAVLCMGAAGEVSKPPVEPLRTITTAREAHSVSTAEAMRGLPVHLRVTVTYYDPYIDPRHGAMFVVDSSGGVFVRVPSRPILSLHAGMMVDLKGVSAPGDYAPVVEQPTIRVLSDSGLPVKALKVTIAELLSGSVDCQWVEIEGLVHAVHLLPNDVVLDIATKEGLITAIIPREGGTDYDSLVDALIRIHGNAAPVFNRSKQMVGVHLYSPSISQAEIIEPAPRDPFSVSAVSISDLLKFTPKFELAHRTRVQGTVTLDWPGRMLCIAQGSVGLCVQTADPAGVRVGSLVDVVGFPAIDNYKAALENAIFQSLDSGGLPPAPKPLSAAQALNGDHDGQLVTIEGVLIGKDIAGNDPALLLRSGGSIFPVVFPREGADSQQLRWNDGSVLRVTGICMVQVDSKSTMLGAGAIRAGSMQIFLRSLDDVHLLRAPSWWTPEHALSVIGLVCLLAFAAFAWVVFLRRRVAQQTKALRASEERLRHLSEHDVLTNLPNRFLLNDRLEMALRRVERFRETLGLLMVDVDRFKQVNDTLGHQAGDRVLCELARRILAVVRRTDTVARLGGDEFIVLLPDLKSRAEANAIAAKVVAAVSAPMEIDSTQLSITVSVGVCTYPEGGADPEKLLQHVDAAMYNVKSHGRNGFHVYAANERVVLSN